MRRRVFTALVNDDPRRDDEFETVEFRPDDTERDTTSIELSHSHLPQLDEAGFEDWKAETWRVTRGESFQLIRPLLELIDDHEEELPGDWP